MSLKKTAWAIMCISQLSMAMQTGIFEVTAIVGDDPGFAPRHIQVSTSDGKKMGLLDSEITAIASKMLDSKITTARSTNRDLLFNGSIRVPITGNALGKLIEMLNASELTLACTQTLEDLRDSFYTAHILLSDKSIYLARVFLNALLEFHNFFTNPDIAACLPATLIMCANEQYHKVILECLARHGVPEKPNPIPYFKANVQYCMAHTSGDCCAVY